MQEESSPTEEAPSRDKQKSMRTMPTWTTPALAKVITRQLLAFTILRNRALPIAIMLWTKPSLASCKIFRIIDLRNSKTSSNNQPKTEEFSRTTSCYLRRVPMQECSRLFIIANNPLAMVPSKWLAMCIRTTTAQKEQFKAWKCTYEAKTKQSINESVLTTNRSDTVMSLRGTAQ